MTTTRTKPTFPSIPKEPTKTAVPTEGWYAVECWHCKEDAEAGVPAVELHLMPGYGPKHKLHESCWCHPERDAEDNCIVIHKVAQ